ncbi:MAG: recombination protein RecR [Parcubacteria group bacterium CG10_big_fil_rev_8_21_14_0_10_38_31]|nr:MAG: recombination protein RecR [Parcubacteria group bacterium CG10_big_fil_rev_8_21_14_0_10_38_31]
MPQNILEKVTEYFLKFPGIGPKQARRFAYFLSATDEKFVKDLSSILIDLKNSVKRCLECYRFFEAKEGASEICGLCSDSSRDSSLLLVVEKDVDFENIERSRIYNGLYFILGGVIPLAETEPTSRIRAKELFNIVQKKAKLPEGSNLREVIIATSATIEGENTVQYIKKILEPLASRFNLKISVLGRGLSTGTELEYSDSSTLSSALKNRG